jgi:hypothetical protein
MLGKITKTSVDRLEPWTVLWDSEVKGFGVRRHGADARHYLLRYRFGGKQTFRRIGRHGSPFTPDTARQEARRLLGLIATGVNPAAQPPQSEDFGSEVERYLTHKQGLKAFAMIERHLRKHPCGDLMMIDLAGVQRDRDQLWAEAVVAERTGEPLVISEKLWPDAKVQQEARMEVDPWADAIEAALHIKMKHWPPKVKGVWSGQFALADDKNGNRQWRVSSDFLLVEVLELPKQRQSNNHTKRLAKVMRSLGWELNRETMRIGDKVLRGYFKPQGQGEVKA